MLYNAFFTLIIALMSNNTQGCHSGLRKRSLTIRAQGMTSFFAKCLLDSAGKEFRWHAITRFAIEDTTWYDETSGRFCRLPHITMDTICRSMRSKRRYIPPDILRQFPMLHLTREIDDFLVLWWGRCFCGAQIKLYTHIRGVRDTDECWRAQLDFFVNPVSKYSHHIKRCIQEYASKGSRSLPHFAYDESLQSVRTGRWKRAVFGQPWFDRRRFVRPRFVPPARTTRTAAVPHYVPPLRTNSPPRHPSPPVHNNYFGNTRPPHSSNPFTPGRTPTARSQTSKPATVQARFTDLSRYDQMYVSLLQRMLQQQSSTPRPSNQHHGTQTPRTMPFKKTTECNQSSRSRFEGCVSTALDDPIGSPKRSLMLGPDVDALSKEDLRSIFRFFRDSYSPCLDEQTHTPITICSVMQVRSQSASASMCLPSIMVRLVRKDSELRKVFSSCASRNS